MKFLVHRPVRATVLAGAALALVLAACAGNDAEQGGSQDDGSDAAAATTAGGATAEPAAEESGSEAPGELFPVQITVTQWPSQLHSVPYIVAFENGYFEDEGLQVDDVVSSEGGGTTVRNLLTGELDFAEASTSALATAYIAGAPVQIVGGGVQALAEAVWVGTADSPHDSLDDVVAAGGTIGYTNPGSVSQAYLQLILEEAGYDPATVDVQATGGLGGGLTALESGGVDATLHVEPILSTDPDPYKVLWQASDYLGTVQATSIATSPEFAEANPEIVEAFIRARARAIDFIRDEPEQAAEMYAEAAGIEAEAALNGLNRVLPHEYYGVGFAEGGLETTTRAMRVLEEIGPEEEVPWDEFVNEAYLPN